MTQLSAPINIFSGERGLGGALTNPTEMARGKGNIQQAYAVVFLGRWWPDVETAYGVLHKTTPEGNDQLMVELIAAKFKQHPLLATAVADRGGAAWLATCSHLTNARTDGFRKWEGVGRESRFIRNLETGYEMSLQEGKVEDGQSMLF